MRNSRRRRTGGGLGSNCLEPVSFGAPVGVVPRNEGVPGSSPGVGLKALQIGRTLLRLIGSPATSPLVKVAYRPMRKSLQSALFDRPVGRETLARNAAKMRQRQHGVRTRCAARQRARIAPGARARPALWSTRRSHLTTARRQAARQPPLAACKSAPRLGLNAAARNAPPECARVVDERHSSDGGARGGRVSDCRSGRRSGEAASESADIVELGTCAGRWWHAQSRTAGLPFPRQRTWPTRPKEPGGAERGECWSSRRDVGGRPSLGPGRHRLALPGHQTADVT
jgi:hypothetical protein